MYLKPDRTNRWLLSYADFVTLLFAVFVMMYAMEKSRGSQVPVAAPKPAAMPAPKPAAMPAPPKPPSLLESLQTNLIGEQEDGFLSLSVEPRGVVITLNDKTLFKPGEALIRTEAEQEFETLGGVLALYPNHLLLEGHTDSVPIHNARFQSNWELSTARSIAVMQLFEQHAHIPALRFSIGGSADNAPVATDSTEPGRARNRRVDIVVIEQSPGNSPVTGR